MLKATGPWDWSLDQIPQDLRQHTVGLKSFIPLWATPNLPVTAGGAIGYDYLKRVVVTNKNAPTPMAYIAGAAGIGLDGGNQSLAGVDLGQDVLGGATEFTAFVIVDLNGASTSSTTRNGLMSRWTTNDLRLLWRVENVSRNVRFIVSASGGTADAISSFAIAASGLEVIALRYDGTTVSQFRNGVVDSSTATTSGAVNAATNNYSFGANSSVVGSNNGFRGIHYGALAWHRAMGDGEVATVSEQIFRFWEQDDFSPAIFGDIPVVTGAIMNQFQGNNMGADLYNGTFQ